MFWSTPAQVISHYNVQIPIVPHLVYCHRSVRTLGIPLHSRHHWLRIQYLSVRKSFGVDQWHDFLTLALVCLFGSFDRSFFLCLSPFFSRSCFFISLSSCFSFLSLSCFFSFSNFFLDFSSFASFSSFCWTIFSRTSVSVMQLAFAFTASFLFVLLEIIGFCKA